MRTRSVNTEILFNLSSSRNITESLKSFGATEKDKDILVCTIDKVSDEH
jgi:tRNA threonylcarbamoyladenosine modification (KEOPS) complex Cgi121 subunit